MKREIKFRGKRKDNGKWIVGLLIRKNRKARAIEYITHASRIESEYYIQTLENVLGVDQLEEFKVHPESIGQYIGVKDRNEKEIYEGDIDQSKNIVMWSNEKSLFCLHFYLHLDKTWIESSYPIDISRLHIIGNRTDNSSMIDLTAPQPKK